MFDKRARRSKRAAKKVRENNWNKCKAVKKNVVKGRISHGDYKKCLFTGEHSMKKMNVLRSHKHEIFSETVYKIALSANDDKRIIIEEKISTLALGHFNLGERE